MRTAHPRHSMSADRLNLTLSPNEIKPRIRWLHATACLLWRTPRTRARRNEAVSDA